MATTFHRFHAPNEEQDADAEKKFNVHVCFYVSVTHSGLFSTNYRDIRGGAQGRNQIDLFLF